VHRWLEGYSLHGISSFDDDGVAERTKKREDSEQKVKNHEIEVIN
jgi:hypothetical protein